MERPFNASDYLLTPLFCQVAIRSRGKACRSIVVECHQYGMHSRMMVQYESVIQRRMAGA